MVEDDVDCHERVIRAMEDFLWLLANNNHDFKEVRSVLLACKDVGEPYLAVINGNDPGNTLSSAISYYQYVRYVRKEVNVDKNYLLNIDMDLRDPNAVYSIIIDSLVRALRTQDYVVASFLADLAFIVRSYVLCINNNVDREFCEWLRRSFKTRVLILRGGVSSSL